jgi:hypothetical protein
MVLYISFYAFSIFPIFGLKSKWGLAFGFIEECQFEAKIDRNPIFLGRKAQISDWLHIMVMHTCFYDFKKNSIFTSKSKGISPFFTEIANLQQN